MANSLSHRFFQLCIEKPYYIQRQQKLYKKHLELLERNTQFIWRLSVAIASIATCYKEHIQNLLWAGLFKIIKELGRANYSGANHQLSRILEEANCGLTANMLEQLVKGPTWIQ